MGSGGSVPLSNRHNTPRDSNPVNHNQEESQESDTEGPTDSQGPSPYATLRRDDWWQHRPSAPSLPGGSSVRGSYEANAPQSHSETLLAYASQMTGWQSGAGSNLGSSRSEFTELSRTVSCLAAANQQLAAAHGAALSHLEALYRDLRTSRLSKDCEKEEVGDGEASARRRIHNEEEDREKRQTRIYVARLESLLAARSNSETLARRSSRWSQTSRENGECRTENSLQGEGDAEGEKNEERENLKKAFARIEELEDTLKNERLKTNAAATKEEKAVQCDEVDNVERDQLRNEIEIQRERIERLEQECEASTTQREKVEVELLERVGEVDRLAKDLEDSKTKRISLEEELQRSLADREYVKVTEAQKSAKLRAQLAEEVGDKKKQIKALEDALEEIQRLKVAVKTEKRDGTNIGDDAATPKESCSETTTEVLENAYDSEDAVCSRATNMEEFKKELTLKREARQRAIAAVSSEMDRLRRELGAEKEAHSETSRMLDLLKSEEPGEARESAVNERPSNCTDDETMKMLKIELQEEKQAHQETLRRITAQQIADTLKVSDEIKNFVRFEAEKLEDLRYHLERDSERHEHQIFEVKEAVGTARLVLAAREKQVNKLKDQLAHILARLDGSDYTMIFDDARSEFDHQLENLRNFKTLYKVRLKVLVELKEHTTKELAKTKEELEISQKKLKALEEDLEKSEEKVDIQDTEISNLESQLGLTKADCRDLENQMSVINSLFTQMLLSASSADMDLDRLTRLLQENHDLISNMAREEGTEAAALPKLLLDLVEQVEGRSSTKPRTSNGDGEKNEEDIQEENIAHNLPKVWRVLLELLSCHEVDVPSPSASALSAPDSCYKSVDTPSGPQLVISVSKTYIRLKELILEKKHLEKEMTRMKQLNTHLESKLGEQEKRLSTVSSELSKTWNIVGRMQAQHQQLHTHEKILRYELQQKRKMLQELKQELEYCREKWESARQKNTNTELEWKSLRREFAARKALAVRDSLNNSGESGFSDERGDESDEEDEGRAERIRISPRRRTRKESPRVPTPDTESEQPTDTEMSESKTCSSETLEQRTPTPETETEVDAEMVDVDSVSSDPRPATPEPDCTPEPEILDPLDRALTNVIQSLIKIDTVSNPSSASTSRESLAVPSTSSGFGDSSTFPSTGNESFARRGNSCRREAREWSPHSEPWSSRKTDIKLTALSFNKKPCKLGDVKFENAEKSTSDSCSELNSQPVEESGEIPEPDLGGDDFSRVDSSSYNTENTEEGKEEEEQNSTEIEANSISVFSIGPYPTRKSPSPVKTVQFREPLILGPAGSICGSNPGETSAPQTDSSNETEPQERNEESNHCSENCESSKCQEKETASSSIDAVNDVKPEDDVEAAKESEPETKESIESSSGLEAAENSTIQNEVQEDIPSTSSSSVPKPSRTPEEVLASRAARLKRLEEQADWLMKKMNATSQRGSALSSRLEELHEVYGEPPAPPPLPDILPAVRLETNYERDEERERELRSEASSSGREGHPALKESETHTDANESPPDNAP